MRKRIVYTRHEDGGVSICCPALEIIQALSCGGYWSDKPRGFAERQIESMIARGVSPDAARNYARAVVLGGCNTQEALAIIRDRDCAHLGRQIELFDIDEIPADRWFRNAWRRSHNGGPISISLPIAKRIQFAKIKSALNVENKRREGDLDLFDEPLALNWGRIRDQIRGAQDEIELRRVWPAELS